jgi:serine/threonine protein kinase/tetratricopeptide (TPR) repeat protein
MSPQFRRVKAIVQDAVEKADPAERAAYLDAACGGDATLRRHVEALLHKREQAGSFLNSPVPGTTTGDPTGRDQPATGVESAATAEAAGDRVGPYKLLQKLGEGGMGVVWVAEQAEPVRRRVALKVIKAGMDSAQVLRRFEAERQALALMEHANIAKVFDAGATASGRPYFVMELVQGVPITRYCDEHHLLVQKRLELFILVCQAIQHAHQKGIIHRDVKPSNVLVAIQDGTPVPKVIDFGVAKALHQRLTDESLYTEIGAIIGTLEYMSPEQAGVSPLGVDTRADVYALGVLLYELLTGTTPLDRARLRRAAYSEAVRLIKEETPPKPSTRLTHSTESLAGVAALRGTEPARLAKQVRGDLDWIVMKALEKDRTRRYEAASGLARDVERFLHDEPVEACPPSARYRLAKFLRKYRGPVAAGLSLVVLLAAGVVGTSLGLVRADRARDEAVAAREAETAQRRLAEANEQRAVAAVSAEKAAKEAAQARQVETRAVLDFVENRVIAAARPENEGGLGHDVTLRRAIETARPFVEQSFHGEPLIEAHLRQTLGFSFQCLGDYETAADQFETSRAIYAKLLGPGQPATLHAMTNLAYALQCLARHAESLKLCEETLALCKAKLGPDHSDTLRNMSISAANYRGLGRPAEALKRNEESLALRKASLGPEHSETLVSMNDVAGTYVDLGRYPEAVMLYEKVLALSKATLGPHHHNTQTSMQDLGKAYIFLGRNAEASGLFAELLAIRKADFGPEHPDTLRCMHDLASAYLGARQFTDAAKLLEKTLVLQKAKLGPDHHETLQSKEQLGTAYSELGRHPEALKLGEEVLALRKVKLGPDHPLTLTSMHLLASSYSGAGRHAESLKLNEETLALRKAKLGPDHPDTLQTMNNLAIDYTRIGRRAEALKLLEETEALNTAKLGPRHPTTAIAVYNIACWHALEVAKSADKRKEADLAMAWLNKAVDAGFPAPDEIGKDPDLDSLHGRDDFKKLLTKLGTKPQQDK